MIIRFESYNKGFEDGYKACNNSHADYDAMLTKRLTDLQEENHNLWERLQKMETVTHKETK